MLKQAGINVPRSQLLESPSETLTLPLPLILKAQVLSGKRAAAGGIIKVDNSALNVKGEVNRLSERIINKEVVKRVLVEEIVEFEKEFYISIFYDTQTREPVLTIGRKGGSGVEQRESQVYPIDPLNPASNLPKTIDSLVLEKLIGLFFTQDCLLVEVNPLALTKKGEWVALDAKIKLDETALGRHPDWNFPPRSVPGYTPTVNEIEAKKIDEGDYRGTAGSTYFDLDGDIAVLASGGGASLTAMDALLKLGGRAANYTEYSGNPPKEKVIKLTKIVLSNPNIHGLWVVGAVANFTDIYETLSGFLEALRTISPSPRFPVVIRRGGPRDKEAFEMLREVKEFRLYLYGEETSIAESAKIMVDLAKEYRKEKDGAASA